MYQDKLLCYSFNFIYNDYKGSDVKIHQVIPYMKNFDTVRTKIHIGNIGNIITSFLKFYYLNLIINIGNIYNLLCKYFFSFIIIIFFSFLEKHASTPYSLLVETFYILILFLPYFTHLWTIYPFFFFGKLDHFTHLWTIYPFIFLVNWTILH